MAARSKDALLDEYERLVPSELRPLRPVMGGIAAQLAYAEAVVVETLVGATTVEGAEGDWLVMMAQGQGLQKGANETDAQLRVRIQTPEGKVTRPAILDIVNEILATYTEDEAVMIEWWDETELGSYADDEFYLGEGRAVGSYNTFTLVLPVVGTWPDGAFLYCDDEAYLDDTDSYASGGTEPHPVYAAIYAAVRRAKSAGFRPIIVIDLE
jgi:hypothetical protein